MASFQKLEVTWQFLDNQPQSYYIYGDSLQKDFKDSSSFREHPRAFGFIVKKFSDDMDGSFYRPEEYIPVFFEELKKLKNKINTEQEKIFYISPVGIGSANKFYIWEKIIRPFLTHEFKKYSNVIFCWES
jgi:hypothetical protein